MTFMTIPKKNPHILKKSTCCASITCEINFCASASDGGADSRSGSLTPEDKFPVVVNETS